MADYKMKQFNGKKFRMYEKLWEGSWVDKRKPLYIILSGDRNDLFDSMYVWKLTADGQGNYVEEINCENTKHFKNLQRYYKSKKSQVIIFAGEADSDTLSDALEQLELDEDKDLENEDEEYVEFDFRNKQPKKVKETKKELKVIPESMWIRARDYQ